MFMLCSCRKSNMSDTVRPDISNPIEYSVYTVSTKGLDPVNKYNLEDYAFGVFGFWSPSDQIFPGSEFCNNLYIDNGKGIVETVDENKIWKCDPKAYWPLAHNVSFFAYSPYFDKVQPYDDEEGNPIQPELRLPSADYSTSAFSSALPRGTFSPKKNITKQTDLCVAIPQLNLNASNGPVNLEFYHTLTRIEFYINIKGSRTTDVEYQVEQLAIEGILETNNFTFSTSEPNAPIQWDPATDDSQYGSFVLTDSDAPPQIQKQTWINYTTDENGEPITENGKPKYTKINNLDNGRLYLLPQSLTDRAQITLQIALYKGNSSTSYTRLGSLQPITIKLPTTTPWLPSKTIKYYMTIDLGSGSSDTYIGTEITGVMEAWKESGNTHSQVIPIE